MAEQIKTPVSTLLPWCSRLFCIREVKILLEALIVIFSGTRKTNKQTKKTTPKTCWNNLNSIAHQGLQCSGSKHYSLAKPNYLFPLMHVMAFLSRCLCLKRFPLTSPYLWNSYVSYSCCLPLSLWVLTWISKPGLSWTLKHSGFVSLCSVTYLFSLSPIRL